MSDDQTFGETNLREPMLDLMSTLYRVIRIACPGMEMTGDVTPMIRRGIEGVLIRLAPDAIYVTVEGWQLRIGVDPGSIAPASPEAIGRIYRVPWEAEL